MRVFASAMICCVILGCGGADDAARTTQVPSVTTTATEPPHQADSSNESASAGMSLVHFHAGSGAEMIAAAFEYDLVVTGSVESVANIPATNGNPPLVTMRIERVLHGKSPGNHVRVIWEPFPHDVDYNIPEKEPRYKAWAKTPMAAPVVGEKYILMLNALQAGPRADHYACSSICRLPLSPDVVQEVLRGLEKQTER